MSDTSIDKNPYYSLFSKQRNQQYAIAQTTYKQRIKKLNALQKAITITYREALKAALYTDFKKPYAETDLTEILPIVSEIKFAKKQLKYWMGKHYAKTPISLLGASSYTRYEPKGVCLLISPWNFPINLTFGPLVSAIAAGNTVIIKPSELTPHTSSVMEELVKSVFVAEEITLIQGDAEVAKALLELPFNHIFFTGAPTIGKIVMQAAAKHLASVTLELGGKSPVIVDTSTNIDNAAKIIAWGKCINNGQVCVAPDYLLIHESMVEKFIAAYKKHLEHYFSKNPSTSASYGQIVNKKHFNRIRHLLIDAQEKGAQIRHGGDYNENERYIAPTLLTHVPKDAAILHEEIFGPILPILPYTDIKEAVTYINQKEKPLALYIFSKRKRIITYMLQHTSAGTSAINTTTLQFSNHHLPFGGVNHSGIGKAHGFYGFQEFSNCKAILKQHIKSATTYVYPPYTNTKEKLIRFVLRWFS